MNPWQEAILGLALGGLLGLLNFKVLAWSVRNCIKPGQGKRAFFLLWGGWLIRYVLVALVAVGLMRACGAVAALALLGGLAATTMARAVCSRTRSPGG
ncbi:MAG: ATP synthase subunit I [Lentisphaerae bacterium]|nr:ATP synthase subunit I [Lentisphaerota bacterium]